MGRTVVGVDIGSASIRAVEVADSRKAMPEVVRCHEVALPEGAVRSGEVMEPHTVATALSTLWSAGGFRSKDVVLGMGNHRVLAREVSVPRMSMRQVREALPFQVQDLLPVPVADTLLDFYPVSETMTDTGPMLNGLLVAAVKEAVNGNVAAVTLAGLNTVDVDLIPFALTRVLARAHSEHRSMAFVEVGAATTSVVVVVAGVPQFVRIIPTGGADVTAALVARLGMEPDEAESAKRSIGSESSAVPADQHAAADVIAEYSRELVQSIQNTLNYVANTRQNDPVSAVVLAGGGAQLPGLAARLATATGVDILRPDAFSTVTLGKNVDLARLAERRGAMTVALGLALGSAA
ncbi:type IV pilus assembly protein PilM [Planctomonas psychrotolerans]|uniref:type IV pilus assembly protein PilM n=1 Tax=Planctomonas psychrotolerans TaxID=2528712 RepID=UPI001239565A|nr:type IV pilus assembly protein PilM [Planctomonas psychrotolerans]